MSNLYYNCSDLFISSAFATAVIKFHDVTLNELNFSISWHSEASKLLFLLIVLASSKWLISPNTSL